MTKESCEKIISKHYHKDWKNTYVYLVWNKMEDGQRYTYVYLVWNKMEDGQRFLLPKMDIIKNGDDYEIEIVKELI